MSSEMFAQKFNQGILLQRQGHFEQSIVALKAANKLDPKNAQALYLLGLSFLQLKDYKRASNFINKSTKLDSGNADVWSNLGVTYRFLKEFEKAKDCFEKGLNIDSGFAECRYNLAITLKDLGDYGKALEVMSGLLNEQVKNAQLYFTQGNILHEAERYEEAIESFKKACELKSDYKEAWVNLGNNCKLVSDYTGAITAYEAALKLDPENHAVAVNKGMILLQQGNYEDGWPLYERRIEIVDFQPKELKKMSSPRWKGEDVNNKRVLIYAEQGLGDTVQFIRYATWVKTLGAHVILYIDKPLKGLLSELEGVDEVWTKSDPVPKHDYRVSVMSLPSIYHDLSAQYEFKVPYLKPKPEFIEKWAERLSANDKLKVGIVWQGNPDYIWDRFRSTPLSEYLPLINNDQLQIFALQVGDPKHQLKKLSKTDASIHDKIIDIGAMIQKQGASFDDTAAIVSQLDAMVVADTSMAHIAGALGVPVMTALNVTPDWRWRHGTVQADYYPSMTLFRQRKRRDWQPVFDDINQTLNEMV